MMNEKLADKVLTDSQMESVAGGNFAQVAFDANFFNDMGLYPHRWNIFDTAHANVFNQVKDEMVRLYSNYGISFACDSQGQNNVYFYGTKRLSQEEAQAFVRKKLGK